MYIDLSCSLISIPSLSRICLDLKRNPKRHSCRTFENMFRSTQAKSDVSSLWLCLVSHGLATRQTSPLIEDGTHAGRWYLTSSEHVNEFLQATGQLSWPITLKAR